MSKNDLNDAINSFAKSVPRLQDQFVNTNRALQELAKPVDLGDPDKFAPNRTANNTEKMVELLAEMNKAIENVEQSQAAMSDQLSAMQEKSQSSENKNFWLTYILIGIGVLTLIATIVGIFI